MLNDKLKTGILPDIVISSKYQIFEIAITNITEISKREEY